MKQVINVGLIGMGTVGTGVIKILSNNSHGILQKIGIPVVVKKIMVRNLDKTRNVDTNAEFTTNIDDIIKMGYNGSEDVNNFIDKYSDSYDFKIYKMTPEQANEIGEMSIKLSKTFANGNTAYCVITPIGK